MNNSVYRRGIENVTKHRDIKLVTTKARKKYLASENNHTTKYFSDNALAIETKRTQILVNKLVFLGLS